MELITKLVPVSVKGMGPLPEPKVFGETDVRRGAAGGEIVKSVLV
jgi:hypothetical protein